MMKKLLFFFAIALVASFGLVSCIDNDVNEASFVQGYRIDIPVQSVSTKAVAEDNGNAVATYKTTENVYVYNASTSTIDDGVLHPTADVTETTFSGTLNKTYSAGNTLKVLYNTNSQGVVDYSEQDGSIDGVKDAGMGEVTISSVSGGVITTNTAQLDNLQSIFRFTFRINGTSTVLGNKVRFVRIFSKGGYLQSQYDVIKNKAEYGPVTISRNGYLPNNYVYAGLRLDKQDDQLVFQVITSDGKVYSGSKNAPSGGFDMGKFYRATVDVDLYTFTVSSGRKVCFSPGDLGVDNGVYSFTEPFTTWGWGENPEGSVSKRVWFNNSEIDSNDDAATAVYGIRWRNPNYVSSTYEMDNVVARTIDGGNVNPYYRVKIGSYNCLLLPPDEAVKADVNGLSDGATVTDYYQYLAKGFVILTGTGRAIQEYAASGKWGWDNSTEGWYWNVRSDANRFYFRWTSTEVPASAHMANQLRLRVRLVRDIE